MKHVIDSTDLTVEEIDGILKLAQDIIDDKEAYSEACKGKNLQHYFLNQVQEQDLALNQQ